MGLLMSYLRMRHWTRLAQPVSLVDLDIQPLVHGIDELLRQRRGAARDHLERREVVLLDQVAARQVHDDGRRHVDEGDLVVLDRLAEDFEVEGRHHDELDAAV